jgi:hypothetical protein
LKEQLHRNGGKSMKQPPGGALPRCRNGVARPKRGLPAFTGFSYSSPENQGQAERSITGYGAFHPDSH